MTIAFDLDGTIGAHPEKLNNIARALSLAGHRVLVLTAAAGELPPVDRPSEVAKRLLKLGFHSPHLLVCIESRDKGHWCKSDGVDVMIDDEEQTLELVKAHSPNTICLKIL